MITRDNIHYTTRTIDGYNLPFNFIISEREAGKTTAIWLDKSYKAFKENQQTTLVVRRKVVHITKSYIDDISHVINKFTDDKVVFEYPLSAIKDGIVDILINGIRFIRICALSIDITALKSLMLRDLRYIVFDEFICNARFGEKYLKDESTKFMEVYNTFRRESENLKCFFLGNPYSLYNPYFIFFNIPTSKLKRGAIVSDGKSYVVECYQISNELRSKILNENPLYQFDNSYTKYAFEGININDENIIIREKIPENYSLQYIFKIGGKYIGIFRNNLYYLNEEIKYHCQFIVAESISKRRDVIAFDFEELVQDTIMLAHDERMKFQKIKDAMRKREIAFQNIECYYLTEEIYFNL